MDTLLLLCFLVFFFVSDVIKNSGAENQQTQNDCNDHLSNTLRLKCQLLKDYDSQERPVKSVQDFLPIHLEMYPIALELDDYSDKLSLSTWMIMNWTDIYLTWRPEEYDPEQLKSIEIECSSIWTPDLISISELAEDPYQSIKQSVCKVFSNGEVNMVFSTEYNAYCLTDRTLWPYDQHYCNLYLGSRSYTGPSLKFTLEEIETDTIKKNKQWYIEELAPKITEIPTMSKENYTRLDFQFTFKRHASVASFCFVFPGIAMAILVVAVLWLDVMVPERLYMLAIVIFNNVGALQYFMYVVPPNGMNPPNLILFFRDSIAISGFCIIITIISRLLLNTPYNPVYLTILVRFINEKSYLKKYLLIHPPPTGCESKEMDDVDDSTSRFSLSKQTKNDWWTLVILIDRLLCITIFLLFIFLLLKFYPVI